MIEPKKTTYADGTQCWSLHGKTHRVDGPAIIHSNGARDWFLDGKPHRVDGPACTYADGGQWWYLYGKLHRVGGPAVIFADGTQCWFLDGSAHRVDGPAITHSDGEERWYLYGKRMSEPEHAAAVAKLAKGASEMTDKEKDTRIAQLEDALLACTNLWNDEIAARKRVEDQHIALVRKFLFKTKEGDT